MRRPRPLRAVREVDKEQLEPVDSGRTRSAQTSVIKVPASNTSTGTGPSPPKSHARRTNGRQAAYGVTDRQQLPAGPDSTVTGDRALDDGAACGGEEAFGHVPEGRISICTDVTVERPDDEELTSEGADRSVSVAPKAWGNSGSGHGTDDTAVTSKSELVADGDVKADGKAFGPLVAVDWAAATTPGPHSANQDRWAADGAVFVVADGIGQSRAGGLASTAAVRSAVATVHQSTGSGAEAVQEAVAAAHEAVLAADVAGTGAGTTVCLATINNGRAFVAAAGDSRVGLVRGDRIQWLTKMDRIGRRLTRRLGGPGPGPVHGLEINLVAGDRLLLCSDGVTDFADPDTIAAAAGSGTAQTAATAVCTAAGGHDDTTAVVVDIANEEVLAFPHWRGALPPGAAAADTGADS